ncbi:DUF2802 domain-containing protein [Propionivibrio limicola]|uniref:DUF2802 domain-containing protein n=1 Tax=Propionivibrio limicola TaxID=167645 RepID=UPI0012921EFA|nr:DUF2802 domain-containing protein [Propionivibrio limicola]
MEPFFWGNPYWRELLLAIVGLLAGYMIWSCLRIKRLGRAGNEFSPSDKEHLGDHGVSAYSAMQQVEAAENTEEVAQRTDAGEDGCEASSGDVGEKDFPEQGGKGSDLRVAVPTPGLEEVGDAIEELLREAAQLRKEVGGLRAEVLVLREELQRHITPKDATQSISPLYSDALQMAKGGHDANAICVQCGISRAEAELVVALARGGDANV